MRSKLAVGKPDRRRGFLLLKPKLCRNTTQIAKAIAKCEGVRDVFLTTGEYAFVVSVEAHENRFERMRKTIRKISRNAAVSTVMMHYRY